MANDYISDPKRWDEIAEHYAVVGELITGPYSLDALDGLDLHSRVRLLDVATGTGALATAAARRGANVLAIDSSQGMVAYLARRASDEGLTNLDARVMNGQQLDLPDASFDLACSAFGVMLFADHRAGLAEMRRVLVSGGSARVVVWASPDRLAHVRLWEEAVRDVFPSFEGVERPSGWRAMMTPEGLSGELERAGFVGTEIRALRHEWRVSSADWLLAQHADSNPFHEQVYAQLGPGSREQVRDRFLERLKREHGDGPFALPTEAWLATARR